MSGPKTNPRAGTDSILVVLGGFGSHQNLVDTVESFCSKTDAWAKLPNLSRKRRYVSAASVANKLYVVGGYDGKSRLALVEKLDFGLEKLQWETVTSMHQRRGLAGICVYQGGRILLCTIRRKECTLEASKTTKLDYALRAARMYS